MARDPRATVEASLEIARRATTGAGEREAAIGAAKRLIERHGLDPDTFDIPGRTKVAPRPGGDLFGSRTAYEEVFRSFEETLKASTGAARQAAAQMDAIRREQERRASAAFADAANGRAAAINRLRADLAVNFLWHGETRVYGAAPAEDGARRWIIPDESALEYDDVGIVEVAKRRGWGAEEVAAGAHPFAVQAAQFLRGCGVNVTANVGGRDWTIVGGGVNYFDKAGHSMLMCLARQRGWQARGAAE